MDRKQLANECLIVEKSGESVREFLAGRGCISPWGTWFRLQKEELGRKDDDITDGKGDVDMQRKITLEQKKKAVDIAIAGGNPIPFLQECGSKAPDKMWWFIKNTLKQKNPGLYAKIPDLRETAKEEKHMEMAPVPQPAVNLTINHQDLEELEKDDLFMPSDDRMIEAAKENIREIMEKLPERKTTSPVNCDGFEVMALRSPATGFRFEVDLRYGLMTWRTIEGDEVTKTAEEWHEMADELLKVLQIFGI